MKRAGAAAIGFALALAGCTFLVTFDELPKDEGELGVPDARPKNDVGTSTSTSSGGSSSGSIDPPIDEDAGSTPVDAAADYSTACTGKSDSKYCNGNQIIIDAGSRDDLITCTGGKTVNVKHCTAGCVRMPGGFPDECNMCPGKATGLYCGDDFVDWHPSNKNTRIRCENGAVVGNIICNTCTGTGPNATCP